MKGGFELAEYLNRALAAYYRSGGIMAPSMNSSGEENCNGKQYVVLRDTSKILAVYRITTSGQLKRLKRVPPGIENFR
jgi:hypothetical protein